MESLLTEYQLRYSKPLSKTEKVATSRRLLTLSNRLSPRVFDLASNTYTYVRILDDAVDESPVVIPLKTQLKYERDALLGKCDPTELQQYYLERVLAECGDKKGIRIRSCLAQIISGLMIDLNIRYTQNPRNNQQLKTRNYLDLWPEIVALSVGAFGKDLTSTPKVRDLMHAWGSYDNLSDMTEDLKCGLVLINREDLEKTNYHSNQMKHYPITIYVAITIKNEDKL